MSARQQLRVRFADDFDDGGELQLPPGSDERLKWRLADFFREWFLPGVLVPQNAAEGTIDRYEEMLRYWAAITPDPMLFHLGQGQAADRITMAFVSQLPLWGYARRGVPKGQKVPIGPLASHPGYSPLRAATIAEHVSRLVTLIRHAGPRFHSRKPAAEIIIRCPYVPLVDDESAAKPPFEWADARAIARACYLMGRPSTAVDTVLWWQTRIALFYFTGLRAGTVTRLAWEHVENRGGQLWLNVPGELTKKTKGKVRKTGKPIAMPVHWQLAELLAKVKHATGASGLILPRACGYRRFQAWHYELQTRAGLAPERQQPPHAWRRTHANQIALLAGRGREVARDALGHDDERTTRKSYLGDELENHYRLLLPPLWGEQGMLFT